MGEGHNVLGREGRLIAKAKLFHNVSPFESGRPEPKGGFKRSTAKSSKSSSPRDQPLVPNKRWSHRIQTRNQVSLLLPKTAAHFELLVCTEFVESVDADLNRSGVVVSYIVDVFGLCS
jgi:hypothetical protein